MGLNPLLWSWTPSRSAGEGAPREAALAGWAQDCAPKRGQHRSCCTASAGLWQIPHWAVQLSCGSGLSYKKTLCSPLNGIRHGLAEGPPWSLTWGGQTLARKHNIRVIDRDIPAFCAKMHIFWLIILPVVWCFGVFLALLPYDQNTFYFLSVFSLCVCLYIYHCVFMGLCWMYRCLRHYFILGKIFKYLYYYICHSTN